MSIKKSLRKIGIVIIMLLILFGGCVIYRMIDDHMIYSIKTIGQTKHKLTVYVEDEITGNVANHVSIEVVQKISHIRELSSVEKKITNRRTDKNGIVVFHLLPGTYRCCGKGVYLGYTDFVDLNKDKETRMKIRMLVQ